MPQNPLIVAGKVYDEDSNPIQGAVVYVYNKTLDEVRSGYDEKFTELTTNSAGEYQCNLANFDGEWNNDDEMWVSAFYLDRAQSLTFKLTGSSVSDKDLTLKNLEPAVAIQKLLRAKLDNPNSDRTATQLVKLKYNKNVLSKDDYPIIEIVDIDEDSALAGISSDRAEERTHRLLITIHVWAKYKDEQILTINGVNYEGTKLRDYLARKITDALRKEFYRKPDYTKDAVIHKFYDYTKERMESMPYDDEADEGVMDKEIEITFKSINQEI